MKFGINKITQAAVSLFISVAILYGVLGLNNVSANTLNSGSSLHVNSSIATPSFTTAPHEDPTSDDTTPTNVGGNLVIKATATDGNGDQWYLAVCKTNAITANSNAEPTCTGGEWEISAATNSASEATVTYTVTASETNQSYAWYAFACDKTSISPACSDMSNSGTSGNNGTPFSVNHPPSFSAVANDGPANPGATDLTISGTVTETDTTSTADYVDMYVCKSNDFNGSACGGGGTWCSDTDIVSSDAWPYRKQISITGQTGAGTNYQVKLLIGETSGATGENFDLGGHATSFPNDIMFTGSDGKLLDYWVESTTGTTPNQLSTVWVEVAADLGSNQNIYIYYGKSGQSSLSNFDNTFAQPADLFNRADNASVGNGWSDYDFGAATVSISGNNFKHDSTGYGSGGGMDTAYASKTLSLSDNFEIVWYQKFSQAMFSMLNGIHLFSGGTELLGYSEMISYSSGNIYFDGSLISNSSAVVAANTNYHKFALKVINDTAYFYYDDVQKYSQALSSPLPDAAELRLGETTAGDSGGGDGRISYSLYDYIITRKVTATEPAYSSAGSEEGTNLYLPACDLTIPNPQAHGAVNYYAYVIDNHSLPASGGQQGAANTFTVNDVAPSVSGTPTFNGSSAISLTSEKSTTNITVTGVATDDNGCADLVAGNSFANAWQTTLVGQTGCDTAGEASGNKCYYHATCVYDSGVESCGGSDKTGGYTCTIPFQYYANPTDADTPWSGDTWTATFIPGDGQGASASTANSGTREMNSYLALGLATSYDSISYGSMSVGDRIDPLQEKTRIEATGNCSLDAQISGTNMTNGGNSIAVSYQKYGLGGTAPAWSAGTALSGTPTSSNLNVCKSGYTATPEYKPVWWGVEIPTGTLPLSYTGTNTLTAVKNSWASTGDWCEN